MTYGRMRWSNAFFVHWRVPPAQLEARLPPGLQLDSFEGDAYVSLVALRVAGPAPKRVLAFGRHLLEYDQLNVRTYVTSDSERGILLLETRIDRPLAALGGRLLGQPARYTRRLDLEVRAGGVALRAPGLDVMGAVSDLVPAQPAVGSLDSFLIERPWVYLRLPGGLVYGLRVAHEPWQVRPVSLARPLPSSVVGVGGAAEPIAAHLAEDLDVSLVEVALVRRPTARLEVVTSRA